MTGPGTAKLSRVSSRPKLAEEVTDSIRQAILTGMYQRGDKLLLEELAADLGVSIMPVREALITLSNEGLVAAEPRRGFRATPLEREDLDDIFEVQARLAGILAARAALVATPADIAQLRTLQARLEQLAGSSSTRAKKQLGRVNGEFHRYINKLPLGDRVRWFLRLTTKFVRQDLFESVPGVLESALRDHPNIIDAMERGAAEECRILMEAHFLQGAHLMGCRHLGDPPDAE
jgi:DNA-binding GntR family transcriptional regulator